MSLEAKELRIGNYKGYEVIAGESILSIKNGKPMRFNNNDKGYPCIGIVVDGKPKYKSVHRIMAETFIPNPDNKPCVNHKDRNRENFSLDNLEWVTYSENIIHSIKNGGRKNWSRNNTGINNPNVKYNWETITAIRDLHTLGYSQSKIGRIFKINQSRITKIVNNKIWKKEK